jgi:D-alanine-D-alanine ligase
LRVTGCLDVARVDFRLDANDGDQPYILEVNPLPGLNPGYSDLCIEAAAGGWTYARLIAEILNQAAVRYGLL